MRDTGIEPVTSSVSGKRSPAELNARSAHGVGTNSLRWKRESNPCARFCRPLPHHSAIPPWRYRLTQYSAGADDETRTRDPHLGKVMRYQLRYIRIAPRTLYRCGARRNIIVLRASFQIPSPAPCFQPPIFHVCTFPNHTGVILVDRRRPAVSRS